MSGENDYFLKATVHYNSTPGDTQTPGGNTPQAIEKINLTKLILDKAQMVYSGKDVHPSVTVLDEKGNEVATSNYTVVYADNKNVGQATVTVIGKDKYKGTITETFMIIPKGTSISKITSKKKAMVIKWKKQNNQTTGYQIQYSTNSKFNSVSNITINKNKIVSKTVKKLKANKKYYERIRTYKTVKIDGKKTKVYSSWSKVKTVKTKK